MKNEMMALTDFMFGENGVRVWGTKLEPWFVCRDVFEVLEIPINYMKRTLKRLDEDEKGVIKLMTPGGEQEVWVVSEPGLYKIMLRSRTPKAEVFTRFVTHEVLPSIRRYGYYDPNVEYTGERGRPRLKETVKLQRETAKQCKYELATGEKLSVKDLRMYCGLCGASDDLIMSRHHEAKVAFLNEKISSFRIGSVRDLRRKDLL